MLMKLHQSAGRSQGLRTAKATLRMNRTAAAGARACSHKACLTVCLSVCLSHSFSSFVRPVCPRAKASAAARGEASL